MPAACTTLYTDSNTRLTDSIIVCVSYIIIIRDVYNYSVGADEKERKYYLADGLAVARDGLVNELRDGQLTTTARHYQPHRVETNGHFHVSGSRCRVQLANNLLTS